MSRSTAWNQPKATVLFLVLGLAVTLARSYDVWTAPVGSCVFSDDCPTGSKCIVSSEIHVGVCYCDPGSCAVNDKCVNTTRHSSSDHQAPLSPEAWFLNETEMTESMGGEARVGLQLWSEGNAVKYYAEAAEFWLDLYREVKAV